MTLALSKFSASGNDFVIFHTFKEADFSDLAKRLCDRHTGLGADGLIALVPHGEYDFAWRFYNSDGSEAAMCGNGSRAAAHYAYHFGLAPAKMRFLTGAGVIEAKVEGEWVESQLTAHRIIKGPFEEEGRTWWLIDTGVPHLVTFDGEFDKELFSRMRQKYDANVNYGKIKDLDSLAVRTFERGVEDETLACGTGMAAVFVRAAEEGLVGQSARLFPKSGEELAIRAQNGRLYFAGRVERVYETFKECD